MCRGWGLGFGAELRGCVRSLEVLLWQGGLLGALACLLLRKAPPQTVSSHQAAAVHVNPALTPKQAPAAERPCAVPPRISFHPASPLTAHADDCLRHLSLHSLTGHAAAGESQELVYHAPFVLPWMPEQPADSAEPIQLTAVESRHTSKPCCVQR